MEQILITINAYKRLEFTKRTVESVLKNKSPISRVLIVDDPSDHYSLKDILKLGVAVWRPEKRMGCGEAQRRTFEIFLESGLPYICSLPNDVIVSKDFDSKTLELFLKYASPSGMACGYRSSRHGHMRLLKDHARVAVSGGVGLVTGRAGIENMLKGWPGPWDKLYDFQYRLAFSPIVVPLNSWIEHVGCGSKVEGTMHPNGHDKAVNFVGEGL